MSTSWIWYTARAAGMVAWALLAITVIFGLVRSTNIGRAGRSAGAARIAPPGGARARLRPVWVVDLHRFLAALTAAFTAVHVVAILADTYVHFDIAQVLVPFSSSWHPVAVAWGTVALYLIVAIEVTSPAQRHLPRGVWRRVHYATLPLFVSATVHGLAAGTDRSTMVVILMAVVVSLAVTGLVAVRLRRATRIGPPVRSHAYTSGRTG
ncbi:MAG: hypothetical protein ACR2MN_06880 [Acidimicrobiales bacterium]